MSGRRIPLRTQSTLQGTRPYEKFECLSAALTSIPAQEAERRVPGLNTGGRSFLSLEESSLDPRDLCTALPLAAASAGVIIEEETEILAVETRSGSVTALTSRGAVAAGSFVNCCGAWAGNVKESFRTSGDLAIVPRKGQMIEVQLEGVAQLESVLRTPDIYLVPRGAGRIAAGATLERVGFDRQVEPAVSGHLLRLAADLWPAMAEAHVVKSWTGLRPGTSDDLPVMGSLHSPNCWIATGHFRNGILLAPATGTRHAPIAGGEAARNSPGCVPPGTLTGPHVTRLRTLRYNFDRPHLGIIRPVCSREGRYPGMSTAVAGKGLEGVVAANSGICWIDGHTGVLAYRGIDIHELAEKSTLRGSRLPALVWAAAYACRAQRFPQEAG